jgi:hypothetical protein
MPEPETPGLLDLLTVAAIGEPRVGDDLGPAPAARATEQRRDTRSQREWVEVEA